MVRVKGNHWVKRKTWYKIPSVDATNTAGNCPKLSFIYFVHPGASCLKMLKLMLHSSARSMIPFPDLVSGSTHFGACVVLDCGSSTDTKKRSLCSLSLRAFIQDFDICFKYLTDKEEGRL